MPYSSSDREKDQAYSIHTLATGYCFASQEEKIIFLFITHTIHSCQAAHKMNQFRVLECWELTEKKEPDVFVTLKRQMIISIMIWHTLNT